MVARTAEPLVYFNRQTSKGTQMYKLKFWLNENSTPEIREGITYALAHALATRAGYAKAQVISEDGVIEFETRWDVSGWEKQ